MTIMQNPYEQGSITHQRFDNSLNHFSKMDNDMLQDELEKNRMKAQDHMTFNFEQLDHYERECRAIEIVLDSRIK